MEKQLPKLKEEEAEKEIEALEREQKRLLDEEARSEKHLASLKEAEKEKKGRYASEKENCEKQRLGAERAKEAYFAALQEQGFCGEEAYLEAKQTKGTMSLWEEEIKDFDQALLKAGAVLSQLKEQTRGRERIDEERWRAEAIELRKELEQSQAEEGVLAGRFSRARQAAVNLDRLWKERAALEDEYQMYHSLHVTANGKLTGSVSLDFQTYVQRQYFSQMVQAANRRLRVMTDGAFLLQCRELGELRKQGEVGLDLDVYSMATDKVRDVKTLSGGESFMAALAMALGMADIIQRTAGNVRVDAMFIDEGFGSLDEESRMRAIRILNELAGESRLIGIISHVTELKEQMDRKLIVTKTESGSRIKEMF